MQFIKNNKLLVILAGVVLVVFLATYFMSPADEVEAALKDRQSLSSTLKRQIRSPLNQDIVNAAEKHVQAVKANVDAVTEGNLEFNMGTKKPEPGQVVVVHEVLKLPRYEQEKVVGTIPAFPVDQQLYRQYALKYYFRQEYGRRLQELVAALEPTREPTDDEIASQAAIEARLLLKRRQAEEIERLREEGGADGAGQIRPVPRRDAEEEEIYRGRSGPEEEVYRGRTSGKTYGRSTTDTRSVEAEAKARATAILMEQQARAGLTYASPTVVDNYLATLPAAPSDADLWRAQVNLWVTEDVLTAIRTINQESLTDRQVPAGQRNVTNAAIKVVQSLEIDEMYFMGSNKVGGSAQGEEEGAYARRGSRSSGSSSSAKATAANLTQRATREDYEVVHYSFTVVMSPGYIQRLQQRLMSMNLHTVLNVSYQMVPPSARGLKYLGTEPVVLVQFQCEWITLANWTRGTWGEVAKTDENGQPVTDLRGRTETKQGWVRPPLMPEQVLRDLEKVLRKEDKDRLRS